MLELFQASLAWANLPITVLLGLILVYWLFVILGFVGMDSLDVDVETDVGFDADLDAGADVQVDVDAGMDAGIDAGMDAGIDAGVDADFDAGIDADADMDAGADADAHAHGHAGALNGFLAFMNLAHVPLMVVLSVQILVMWVVQMSANKILGWNSQLLGFALYIPNFLASLIVTKIVTTPIAKMFKALHDSHDAIDTVVGHECLLISSAGPDLLGQGRVQTQGAPMLVSVRTREGKVSEGSKAIILEKAETGNFYYIERLND
ncbi:DUF1449 domain-containing protein [Sulfidibacter corallicola]|uniref:DUF1449 family protein n=1 Tax=Sulfidibacter corallicola TaxID=2818388 RepID=A0A8A4TQ80_SULCO|nr:OB-fold-containig protein [Sulfidibacter corallicola]QTD51081.1 DUF1449 family protein [Sulfidibacter corallicola]